MYSVRRRRFDSNWFVSRIELIQDGGKEEEEETVGGGGGGGVIFNIFCQFQSDVSFDEEVNLKAAYI